MDEYELSKALLAKKENGVPMKVYLKNGIGLLVYRAVMIGVFVYMYEGVSPAWKIALLLTMGGLAGATLQEVWLHYRNQKNWPAMRSLYNWGKIEETVNSQSD